MHQQVRQQNPNYKILLTYKSFNKFSHAGLGITATNIRKVLSQRGYCVHAKAVKNYGELVELVGKGYTHVVISAAWVAPNEISELIDTYPDTKFAVIYHSNIGFLMAEPKAVAWIPEYIAIQKMSPNFMFGANNIQLASWAAQVYRYTTLHLPNLYYLDKGLPLSKPWNGGPIHIGCFGAQRPLKNHLTAAAASLGIAEALGERVEFYINSTRLDGGNYNAIKQLFNSHQHRAKLIEVPWAEWPQFKQQIGSMDLNLQSSFSESFNVVAADSVSQCIPIVGSSAITWLPDYWQANPDNVLEIINIGTMLLSTKNAGHDGYKALQEYVSRSVLNWEDWINS